MKILAWVSTLDMTFRMGPTIAWWQLLKALHELGNEVTATPYLGMAVETPWWQVYRNPFRYPSVLYNRYLDRRQVRSVSPSGATGGRIFSRLTYGIIAGLIRPGWSGWLKKICTQEKPEVLLILSVPLNHIRGVAETVRRAFGIPVVYYDTDLPMSLPEFADQGAFKFSMYDGADLGEYDLFLSCSKGITGRLMEMGARRVEPFYFAADPGLFTPLDLEKDIDVFYYGHRSAGKEKRMDYMLKEPSLALADKVFYIGGREFDPRDIGNARIAGTMPLNVWRRWCNRSRINLNITKDTDANIYGSSSARPFELAAMGCCIVTDAYAGMEEWFCVGKELCMAHDAREAVSLYRWLLSDGGAREEMGKAARARVLEEHTYAHRARQLLALVNALP